MQITNTIVEYSIDVVGDKLYFNPVIDPHTVTVTESCNGNSFSMPMGGSNPQPFILPVGGGVINIRSAFSVTTFTVERVSVP
jgi:hypothetical protein